MRGEKNWRGTPHFSFRCNDRHLRHGFQRADETIIAKRSHGEILSRRRTLDHTSRSGVQFSAFNARRAYLPAARDSRCRVGPPFRRQNTDCAPELPLTRQRRRLADKFLSTFSASVDHSDLSLSSAASFVSLSRARNTANPTTGGYAWSAFMRGSTYSTTSKSSRFESS
jgi:hypothetical protein